MEKGDERKKQLLRVALDVFIEKGYYGTSTREIARQAGVSSGLLFHYFSNKDSIYLELIKIGIQEMKINTKMAMNSPRNYLLKLLKIRLSS
ncbi:TetR family transcriptional regulator [Lachnospiraceae bacterium WCA-9-b2]|uniref:TetR family transcriptional regulator n=1 Tax=Sporofaciens musculi TaxID=2681861 RepID=A0A7X3MHK6_9FIRM|nr:helix-turn-helix domain-containing protein [Sporofaciens musculi]MXP76568.1 TetR family transcriptional regulator [Sporofaciens musculi]